jgi:hypothetical protein
MEGAAAWGRGALQRLESARGAEELAHLTRELLKEFVARARGMAPGDWLAELRASGLMEDACSSR